MDEQTKLIHYSGKPIEKLEPKIYDQNKLPYHAKPNGLWISVEGFEDPDEINWKEWCYGENFQTENLKYSYEVILKKDENILYLKSSDEIFEFTKKFPLPLFSQRPVLDWNCGDTYQLDWHKVKTLYQGIIIAPYQWYCRLSVDCSWYYGWDCSSGCIWDLDCIEEFRRIDGHTIIL